MFPRARVISEKMSFLNIDDQRKAGRPLSAEKSFVPGGTEEDGHLKKEYVLVDDTQAVEL